MAKRHFSPMYIISNVSVSNSAQHHHSHITTVHITLIVTQSTRSRKRQKTTIDVEWTRDGIQNVNTQYGDQQSIEKNTKHPIKAGSLKNQIH